MQNRLAPISSRALWHAFKLQALLVNVVDEASDDDDEVPAIFAHVTFRLESTASHRIRGRTDQRSLGLISVSPISRVHQVFPRRFPSSLFIDPARHARR